ncbi:hypothetical protein GCM10009734_98400 [Nonomuraea bangladeshensis]
MEAPVPGEVFVNGPNFSVYRHPESVQIASVTLPAAGSYLLHAETNFEQHPSGTPARYRARCDLYLPNESRPFKGWQAATVDAEETGALSFQSAVTTTAPGPVNLVCHGLWNVDINFYGGLIVAQAVPKITKS